MSKKTNYSYIGIAFIILVFGMIFFDDIMDRILNNETSTTEGRSENISKIEKHKSKLSDLLFLQGEDGNNKQVPEFSFINQNGETITNKDYEGKVYVIEFFFTTCPTICPRMNHNLVKIQNEFEDFENFGVASFTINPEYDTPEVLKSYADSYGITNQHWHLMTGEKEAIYELANQGFYIYAAENKDVEGGFEHSGNFALVDKNGFIRCRKDASGNPIIYYEGITSEEEQVNDEGQSEQISALKEDIKKLLNE
ncbi:SCO family protein [Seonamhaeicola aphaedonensis]|uniref:Protein SCO1/2 n=1 Tax=Seonamhaeicola aphaedonensis TaxID=1461338 RepID=A0A3D9HGU7_9FLAO|nr:SCO family protein [Seonamhaeicola aphaedonensis]RED48683.1 protein SCO1/2 [Seonamhaeicola aphaedonensis]